jgi:hypothetical protein
MKSQKFWIVIIRQDERRLQTCHLHPDLTHPLLLQLALKITLGLLFLNFKIIMKMFAQIQSLPSYYSHKSLF